MSDTIALDIKISIDRLKDVLNILDKRESIIEFNLENNTLFVDTEEDFYSFNIGEFIDIVSVNGSPYQEDECVCELCENGDAFFLGKDEEVANSENNYISKTFYNEEEYYDYLFDQFIDNENITILCDSYDLEQLQGLEDLIKDNIYDGVYKSVIIDKNDNTDLYYITKLFGNEVFIEPAKNDNGRLLINENNVMIITDGVFIDNDEDYVLDKVYGEDQIIIVNLEDASLED